MNTEAIILSGIALTGFALALTYLGFRRKRSSWKGIVTGKTHEKAHEDEGGSTDDQYKLTCKTDTGKQVTIGVLKDDYDEFEIGDTIEKRKGAYSPNKPS